MDSVGLGLIGALPPVAFALFGLVAPRLARQFALERLLLRARNRRRLDRRLRRLAGVAQRVGTRRDHGDVLAPYVLDPRLGSADARRDWQSHPHPSRPDPGRIQPVRRSSGGPGARPCRGLQFAPASAPSALEVQCRTGPLLDPTLLVLINLRSRTPESAVALSDFVHGTGCSVGR